MSNRRSASRILSGNDRGPASMRKRPLGREKPARHLNQTGGRAAAAVSAAARAQPSPSPFSLTPARPPFFLSLSLPFLLLSP
eukprot:3672853-Prymnesium_polylepis.1